MARESLEVHVITPQGLVAGDDFTYETIDETEGAKFYNSGSQFVHLKAGSAETEVTIQTPREFDGNLGLDNRVIELGENDEAFVGPFEPRLYNQDDKQVYIDSNQADTEAAVFRLG